VLIKDGGFEFSDAEKEGFLILHMDLTDKQAEVLVQSLQQKAKSNRRKNAERTAGHGSAEDEKIRR